MATNLLHIRYNVCVYIPRHYGFFAELTLPTWVTSTAIGRAIRIRLYVTTSIKIRTYLFNISMPLCPYHGVTTVQPDLGVPRAITGAVHKLYIQ